MSDNTTDQTRDAAPAKSPGRPSDYTSEIADRICERIGDGQSLRTICQDEGMPSQSMVYRWLAAQPEFREQYARAREAQADLLFDEILQIADDGRNDKYTDDEGMQRTDYDVIARSKLRVDARKWMAAKLRPRVYGDKLAIGGADDLPPIKNMTDEELDAAIAKAAAAANGSHE